MALIPLTFPQSYRPVTLQQPFGGDVSSSTRRRKAALFAHRIIEGISKPKLVTQGIYPPTGTTRSQLLSVLSETSQR